MKILLRIQSRSVWILACLAICLHATSSLAKHEASTQDPRLDHWAWRPVSHPVVPPTAGKWCRNDIDRFIMARLAEQSLAPSPQADRRTLIRRVSVDLRGLPPTPEEIETFALDPDPSAYEKLVDRYLNSPAYGEHWARHWLDLAHYADTHGFERDMRRDNAWRYRDYVIRSFNSDKPYDQFLAEQIAGDVANPDDPEAVTATGFLAAGPWDFVGQVETQSPVLRRAARADDLDDMVTQVMATTCAVTINCCRCHDHKLDPISQQEYYALWAVFAGVKRGDRQVNIAEIAKAAKLKPPLIDRQKVLQQQITALAKHNSNAELDGEAQLASAKVELQEVDKQINPDIA